MTTKHSLAVKTVPVASLATYHRNPRRGDVDAIRASLRANGQFRPLVVNRGSLTGRKNEVLAGNHTLLAALAEDWITVQVCWLDVDDATAARIVAADNRTSDLAEYDDATLVALLKELSTADTGLDGSGYSTEEMDNLAALLEEQAAAAPTLEETTAAIDYQPSPHNPVPTDGRTNNRNLEDRAAVYRDRDVRSVYLTFSIAEFEWAVPRLEKLGAQYGAETNAEIVLHLVAAATGDELPEGIAPVSRDRTFS